MKYVADGKIIPAGATIVLATLLMHHNTDIYKNPRSWDPDRFSKEEVAKRHVSSFAAFSVGPRSCIGEFQTWSGKKIYFPFDMKILVSRKVRNHVLSSM